MAPVKRIWSARSKRPAGKLTPSRTTVHSINSWLFCAMRSASSVVIPGRCIWPWLLERLPSPSLVQQTRRETVPIERATPLATLLPLISFCAIRMPSPPTNEPTKLLLPFWKLASTQFSTPFVGKLRSADERGRQFFRSRACTAGLSGRDSSSLVFAAHTSQHLAWRSGRCHWPVGARACSRISSQAGSSHRYRSLRLHSKSALSRQRYAGSGGRNRHALMGVCFNPDCLFRSVLFHRDAAGSH